MKRVAFLLLLLFLVVASPAEAHRDGCHRWHSCPSDTGSYVCGDLGYSDQCGGAAPQAPAQQQNIQYVQPTLAKVQYIVPVTKTSVKIPTKIPTPTLTSIPTATPTATITPTLPVAKPEVKG